MVHRPAARACSSDVSPLRRRLWLAVQEVLLSHAKRGVATRHALASLDFLHLHGRRGAGTHIGLLRRVGSFLWGYVLQVLDLVKGFDGINALLLPGRSLKTAVPSIGWTVALLFSAVVPAASGLCTVLPLPLPVPSLAYFSEARFFPGMLPITLSSLRVVEIWNTSVIIFANTDFPIFGQIEESFPHRRQQIFFSFNVHTKIVRKHPNCRFHLYFIDFCHVVYRNKSYSAG
jgi:hypothetical protein